MHCKCVQLLYLGFFSFAVVPTLQSSTLLVALQSAVKAGGVLLPISAYTPLSILLHDTVGPSIAVSERARQHKDGTDPAWRDMWSVSRQRRPDRWQQLKHPLALLGADQQGPLEVGSLAKFFILYPLKGLRSFNMIKME